jgi:hypothetical protein
MSNTNERKPERGHERIASTNKGPQYIPHDLLDDNYHYRFVYYSNDTMWKALDQERLGYEPVKVEELASIKSKVILPQTNAQDGLVTVPEKGGAMSVLMRIPKAVYLERLEHERLERQEERKRHLGPEYQDDYGVRPAFRFNNGPTS